jgi:hypothetical protein
LSPKALQKLERREPEIAARLRAAARKHVLAKPPEPSCETGETPEPVRSD